MGAERKKNACYVPKKEMESSKIELDLCVPPWRFLRPSFSSYRGCTQSLKRAAAVQGHREREKAGMAGERAEWTSGPWTSSEQRFLSLLSILIPPRIRLLPALARLTAVARPPARNKGARCSRGGAMHGPLALRCSDFFLPPRRAGVDMLKGRAGTVPLFPSARRADEEIGESTAISIFWSTSCARRARCATLPVSRLTSGSAAHRCSSILSSAQRVSAACPLALNQRLRLYLASRVADRESCASPRNSLRDQHDAELGWRTIKDR